jgi:ketol-acid reductoisomerase
MARIYRDEDADLTRIQDQTIGVIGYGNQGRAQACNLKDSGLEVIVGVRSDETQAQALGDGFEVFPIREAAERSQILMMLIPDEVMPQVFSGDILEGLSEGKAICFASGYTVAFGTVVPPDDVDVIMVAPRMIGAGVRQCYTEGKGFPSFIGVHQDTTEGALQTALAVAKGIGSTKSGVLEVTFAQEAELDLFTEQGFGPAFGQVLLSSMQVLIDAGYPVEAVMMELILSGEFAYSMQKIVELGFFKQMELHSHTSQYGSLTRAIRFIEAKMPETISVTMKQVLHEIRSGAFAEEWEAEQAAGLPNFTQLKELRELHPIAEWEKKTRTGFRMD